MRQSLEHTDHISAVPALASKRARARKKRAGDVGPFKFIFGVITVLIIYGSLYPFNFYYESISFSNVHEHSFHLKIISRPGDILGNLALFIPFGSTWMLAFLPQRSRAARFVLLSLAGLLVAGGVQILQLFLPTRDAALGDVLWNFLGWTLGALLVWPEGVRNRLLGFVGAGFQFVPLSLLGLWLVSECAPFVPSMDLQAFKVSLRPLLESPDLLSVEFWRVFLSWLLVPFFVARLLPERFGALWLLAGAASMMLAKVVFVQNSISSGYVIAVLSALSVWLLFLRSFKHGAVVLIAGLVVFVVAAALEPFNLHSMAYVFSWTPFSGALTGSMLTNVKAVSAKLFFFGSLLFLIALCGARAIVAVSTVAILIFALEIAQIWVGEHTPEVTDPLLILLLGAAMSVLYNRSGLAGGGEGSRTRLQDPSWRGGESAAEKSTSTRRQGNLGSMSASFDQASLKGGLIVGLTACIAAALAMQFVLGLPRIPYNVRELFGGEDAWWRLFVFASAGLSIGVGGALVGRLTEKSARYYLVLPAATVLACLVTYLLLVSSVTAESIWDITGSANTYWFVMNRHMWGDAGIWLYKTIGSKILIHEVERFVRFTALFGQVILWIAILSALYYRLLVHSHRKDMFKGTLFVSTALRYFIAAAPWLVSLNLIAFDYSSTDNLNELIGGQGHVLYFLLLLLPFNALVVVHTVQYPRPANAVMAVIVLAVSLPLGWLLLKHGLSPTVSKYGRVFSGVDFLLGPDRDHLLPQKTLMLRWFVVQTVATAGLACGIQMIPRPAERRR